MTPGDVDKSFDTYMRHFLQIYNKHFPVKTSAIKEKHYGKPYITSAIKNSIKHRNRLQRLYAKWPLTYGKIFKQYRNTLTSVIREAKINYNKSRITESIGDSKKTWKVINSLMRKNTTKHLPESINFGNKHLNNNSEIAQAFNEYFCSIARTFTKTIQSSSVPFSSFLPEPVSFSCFFRPTTVLEVKSIISNMKFTSDGHDDVNVTVVKKMH